MADIDIAHSHALSLQQAKEAAQQVADRMAEEYDMRTQWDGDVLRFERSGLEGQLTLAAQQVHVAITLAGFFRSFGPMIEEKIARNLARIFSAA
jgi:putative polyhydroxyalkanoate system protein